PGHIRTLRPGVHASDLRRRDCHGSDSRGRERMTTTTLPHPNTYAVPGSRVLAGEYPFAKEDAQGREKLRRFLDAGITYFVDLTTPEDRLTPYKYALHEYAGRYGSPVYTNLPIPDNGIPSHEHMNRILDVIDRAVE